MNKSNSCVNFSHCPARMCVHLCTFYKLLYKTFWFPKEIDNVVLSLKNKSLPKSKNKKNQLNLNMKKKLVLKFPIFFLFK